MNDDITVMKMERVIIPLRTRWKNLGSSSGGRRSNSKGPDHEPQTLILRNLYFRIAERF